MKKAWKKILSFVLVVSLIMTSSISALAIDGEEYLCELRLVYAEDYSEALDILDDSEFYDYELYDENLNEGTDKIGVFLAYKTTEDIEDAITDIAVMQMKGGYTEGNYQEMIKKSEQEYFQMAQIYTDAIDHWVNAYEAGNFFAEAAYRQLNFYTVIDEESSYNGKLFGDILMSGVDEYELATMFFEGNSYALNNIRSLISMGVACDYDRDTYYLDQVSQEAVTFERNSNWYNNSDEDFDELARLIAPTIKVFSDMFWELSDHEEELNYEDDEYTALEVQYLEYTAIAELMKKVDYLNGKTLYEFCYDFELAETEEEEENYDYTVLYPLVGALNPGQLAMTKALHYYDVVRYGIGVVSEATMTEEIDKLEEKYEDNPFDIYTGVDRSIYDGTFALTSEASRADAYTEGGLTEALFGEKLVETSLQIAAGGLGACLFGAAIYLTKHAGVSSAAVDNASAQAAEALRAQVEATINKVGTWSIPYFEGSETLISGDAYLTQAIPKYAGNDPGIADLANWTFAQKYDYWTNSVLPTAKLSQSDLLTSTPLVGWVKSNADRVAQSGQASAQTATQTVVSNGVSWGTLGVGALYLVGGALMLYSAVSLVTSIVNYYNPDYDDVPIHMVDMINTVDGDRYIKYDVVYEAETRKGGEYAPGDTNAYTGHRWNALYYTKSYEAGKPLLADFDISRNNNTPDDDYAPIHRFGEVVSFDLNRYHMDDADAVYLSAEQSKYQKSAVTDVPELVGSIFSAGWALLAGGVGLLAGIGGTIGTQKLFKKKKQSASNTSEA